ncbi:MAG: Cyclic di-GMP phosphodiesterase response regulator RpfG [Actinobacteria bacterium]|nr:Cyclic di-GMP phosphodiesterase response regulator RpfG [Actinomycetota bacterium]
MKPVVYLEKIEGLFSDLSECAHNCITLHQFSESIGNAIDAKDKLTHNHSQHVAVISYLIALAMGFNAKQADIIHLTGHLHDIGKIGIPDAVLKKAGKFTQEDWKWMYRHSEIGAKIVMPIKAFKSTGGIIEMVLHHHERYDGMGYPARLEGKEIPIGARIIAVADTLSALIQDRHYRKGVSFDIAVEEILKNSGTQFDPIITRVFTEIQNDIKQWLEGI